MNKYFVIVGSTNHVDKTYLIVPIEILDTIKEINENLEAHYFPKDARYISFRPNVHIHVYPDIGIELEDFDIASFECNDELEWADYAELNSMPGGNLFISLEGEFSEGGISITESLDFSYVGLIKALINVREDIKINMEY